MHNSALKEGSANGSDISIWAIEGKVKWPPECN